MWRDIRWTIIKADKINGSKKWIIKNRLKVAPLTEKPPQSHSTIVFPMYGIADTKFVITVAPQKDICPQGKTYPIKAVPIRTNKIMVPEFQVKINLKDEYSIPRLIWIKIKVKKKEAAFMWAIRKSHPIFTSRIIWIVDEKANSTLEL
jgi:hypothetical protein